jgi:hypothetical protein
LPLSSDDGDSFLPQRAIAAPELQLLHQPKIARLSQAGGEDIYEILRFAIPVEC